MTSFDNSGRNLHQLTNLNIIKTISKVNAQLDKNRLAQRKKLKKVKMENFLRNRMQSVFLQNY